MAHRIALLPVAALLLGATTLGLTGCRTAGTGGFSLAAAHAAAAPGTEVEGGLAVVAATAVGDDGFVLGRHGDDEVRFAASIDGAGYDSSWETVATGDLPALAPDQVSATGPGNFPTAAPGGAAAVAGRAGDEVVAIEVLPVDGGDAVPASMADGWWIAAWNGTDFSDADRLDTRVRIRLADGTSRTAAVQELLAP